MDCRINENHELIPDYSGQIVTKDLINVLRQNDIDVKDHNQTHGENEFGEMTDDYIGYFKFYFDHYVDGEVVEHYRIVLGIPLDSLSSSSLSILVLSSF